MVGTKMPLGRLSDIVASAASSSAAGGDAASQSQSDSSTAKTLRASTIAGLSDIQLAVSQADSVVQVFASVLTPSFAYPYSQPRQTNITGTAFVIALGPDAQEGVATPQAANDHSSIAFGLKLLTNHHCVVHASVIQVKRQDQDRWYDARTVVEGYECDLALLTVDSEAFWEGLTAINFQDGFPRLLEPITVLGFPTGGDNLSTTQGVVSRIDVMPYAGYQVCNYVELPVIQIDAAINPGNSGGPALCRGSAVGVAFSGLSDAQSIGYIVPSRVVLRFLRDFIQHGQYTQFAYPPFKWQTLETVNLRRFCGVEELACGVRVRAVDPYSDVGPRGLATGDVVLAVNGTKIGHDGKVPLPEVGKSCRVSLWYLFYDIFTGQECKLTVRTPPLGEERHVSFTLRPFEPPIAESSRHAQALEYLIVAGLVFQPRSTMYMSDSGAWESLHLKNALNDLWSKRLARGQHVIVLSDVLAHPLNLGLEGGCILLERLNGHAVKSLAELAARVDEAADEETLAFEFSDEILFAATAGEARKATTLVLHQNGIQRDRWLASLQKEERLSKL